MKRILLLGDSLIEYGDWDELLPGFDIINRGFAGETAGGLAGRLADEINAVDDPAWIIILSGTNDLLMGNVSFPAVFETMLPLLRNFCPQTEIMVVGLAPMPMTLPAAEEVNARLELAAGDAGCRFLDIFPPFHMQCRPIGNPCFMPDGVHFSPHGYRVLAGAIAGALKIGPEAT